MQLHYSHKWHDLGNKSDPSFDAAWNIILSKCNLEAQITTMKCCVGYVSDVRMTRYLESTLEYVFEVSAYRVLCHSHAGMSMSV